jgi:hypothetical protein
MLDLLYQGIAELECVQCRVTTTSTNVLNNNNPENRERRIKNWRLRRQRYLEVAMSHSMYGADRGTHLKIVAIGFLCAALLALVGKFAHIDSLDLGTAPLVKAGQPAVVSGHLPTVR